jgi:hypothetical protein
MIFETPFMRAHMLLRCNFAAETNIGDEIKDDKNKCMFIMLQFI